MWQRSYPRFVSRTLATGVQVMSSWEVTDIFRVPTDREILRRAGRVEIEKVSFTDDDPAQLGIPANAEVLFLVGTRVTDAGLASLGRMTELGVVRPPRIRR